MRFGIQQFALTYLLKQFMASFIIYFKIKGINYVLKVSKHRYKTGKTAPADLRDFFTARPKFINKDS